MTSKLAVQMYTVRDFTKTAHDFAQSLQKIGDMGYRAVQLSAVGAMNAGDDGAPQVTVEDARKMLDDNGLRCIATHRNWDDLLRDTSREIAFHQLLGCDFTAIGGIPSEYQKNGAEGFRRFLTDAAPVVQALKSAGIRFGYHNHAFEFERVTPQNFGRNSSTRMDVFIEEGGPNFLLELDLYWVAHAGANPQRVVERCRGRMPIIHLKDKEMEGSEPVMAPIGEGNIDWDNLLPACENAGVEWYCIEQDICRRDAFDCLKSSFDYLSAKTLS